MATRTPRARSGRGFLAAPAAAVPVLIGALIFLVPASSSAAPDNLSGADHSRAVELLTRSAGAASQVSYHGTQYVSAWSAFTKAGVATSAVVQVRHQAAGTTEISVDNAKAAVLEGRSGTSWLADSGGPVDLLIGAYDVRVAGEGRVAGRMADVVEAVRADGSVAARLWLDRQTALSLRREAFTADGHLLSASAFVEISLVTVAPCCLRSGMEAAGLPAPAGDESMLYREDIERLRSEGFHCLDQLVDGFVLYEARRVGDAVQLSYSDGVMTVSVFEQAGRLDPDQLEAYSTSTVGSGVVYTNPGPPARFTWSSGGRVITVVADAPLEVVDQILRQVPPEAPAEKEDDGGLFDRIGRGAQKVGSWLNPFD